MPNLTSIDGIGRTEVGKLAKLGIKTTVKLLETGKLPEDRRLLAEKLGISTTQVLEWLIYADFFRIKGMTDHYMHLLQRSGVNTMQELAFYDPRELFKTITRITSTNGKLSRPPTQEMVEDWVKQAVELPAIIWLDGFFCYGSS